MNGSFLNVIGSFLEKQHKGTANFWKNDYKSYISAILSKNCMKSLPFSQLFHLALDKSFTFHLLSFARSTQVPSVVHSAFTEGVPTMDVNTSVSHFSSFFDVFHPFSCHTKKKC